MRISFNTCLVLIIMSVFTIFSSSHAAADEIKWYNYQEAVALGKQENKKLFLHFFADWCTYCKKMRKETFADSQIISFLNRHFISARVNTEKDKHLAIEYAVIGLPVTWFVSETGERISNLPGFVSADMLIGILKFIHTDSYKTMTFSEYLKTI